LVSPGHDLVEQPLVLDPTDNGTDDNGTGSNEEATAKLAQMVTQRHPPVGVALAAQ